MAQRLCVTVTAPTMAELRRRRDEATDADLVELRLDSVRDPDVAAKINSALVDEASRRGLTSVSMLTGLANPNFAGARVSA